MDIDALVARITDEVMQELNRKGVSAQPGYNPAPIAKEQHHCCGGCGGHGGCGSVCTASTTGECSGKGSCTSLIPDKVQAPIA